MSLAEFMEQTEATDIVRHKGTHNQLVPPPQTLSYVPKGIYHSQVIEHANDLATAQIVWTVKKGSGSIVTPSGLAMVTTKQLICQVGSNIVA